MADPSSIARSPASAAPVASVLLVDDDEVYAEFLQGAFATNPPIAATQARSLHEAQAHVAAGGFDVVLLAWSMLEDEGIQWLSDQRQLRDLPPIVVLVEEMDESLVRLALQAGAKDYVVKGESDARTLARVIRYAIEHERYGRQLKLAGQRFKSLIENALDIISIVDADGVMVYQSPATERILGIRATELVGRSLLELIHPDDLGPAQVLLSGLFAGPNVPQSAGFRVKHANGTWLTLEAIGQRLSDGTRPQAVLNLRDITARIQAEDALRQREEQLRQAQKMEAIGRLAGGIAHDFGNLLTVIIGSSDHLVEVLPEDGGLRQEAATIKASAERAASMTQKLLAVGREQVLTSAVLDLNAVIDGADTLFRRLIREDVELVVSGAPALGSVRADKAQLERALMNLVINASDAMPHGGRITIETKNIEVGASADIMGLTPGPYVLLSVTDTGIGMDAATRARAFEPFFTTKRAGRGTGLGLSTVYGILTQSGGNVGILSEPGRGTSVLCYLPRVDAVVPVERPKKVEAPKGTETLLVVEDEDGVRDLVRDILEMAGYRVLDAGRPSIAERLCREYEGTIHLLLTDIVMPEMSGRELADRLSGVRPSMRVLFMSGYPEPTVREGSSIDAEVELLPKPFERHGLLSRVRKVLDRSMS
jgi:PAS domain S-box-containing protein